MDNEPVPHVIADWEIEVNDNFMAAHLTFRAIGEPGNPEASGVYSCRPMFLQLDVLRRLQKDMDGLIRYMEKGVEAPGGSLQ